MSLEVTIVGQDRRHAYDIIVREIDTRINELDRRSSPWFGDQQRVIPDEKVSGPTRALLLKLRALDDAHRKERDAFQRASKRLIVQINRGLKKAGVEVSTAPMPKTDWKQYVIRETGETAQNRIEGSAKRRAEKRARLRELRDEALQALTDGTDLSVIIKEMRTLRRPAPVEAE